MPISKKIIKDIEAKARQYFAGASGCHDFSHVERVRNLALRIGRQEKADLGILEAAALLHDIGRRAEMKTRGKFCHAEKGAEMAAPLLKKYKLEPEVVKNILHCIISHRYRNAYVPATLEAKVLFDADKLDSIGAVGIGRNFLFAGYFKVALYTGREKELIRQGKDGEYTKDDTAILEYEFKLKKIKNKMLTRTGRKIAQRRHDFMVLFFKKFWREVEGKE